MKLFMYYVLLPFATMVVTAPIRARRESVLNLLNDTLATTMERTVPANITALYRNPPSKPVKEQDSEDAFNDLDSHEIVIPKVEKVEKDNAPSRRNTGVDQDMSPMDLSRRLVLDEGSREHSGPHGAHQASKEQTDLNSDEGMTVDSQEAENVSGKQIRLSVDQVTSLGTDVKRKATPGRVNGLNGMLASGMLVPGRSRELLDWDSLEDNNDRPAPVGNRGDTDYDETREFISSETSPIAPPEHMPSSLSVPAKT